MGEKTATYCMLFLTRRCNLDCDYCHMVHDGFPDIDEKYLHKAADLCLEASEDVCLQFFGGEPLMRFDLIESLIDYVKQNHPGRERLKYMITTNGVLLRGRMLDYLLDNDVEIMLSLDGVFDSQSEWRHALGGEERAVFDKLMGRIGELNERNVNFFVNMVVSPSNVDRMEENVRHFKELGVRRLQITYELGAHWREPFRSRYVDNFCSAIERYDGRYEGERGFTLQHGREGEPVLGNMVFIVDVNGDMFRGCAIVLEKTMPRFNDVTRIGHIDDHESLRPFVRSKLDQVTDFLRRTRIAPNDYMLLRSNMHLGYQLQHAVIAMQERRA